MLTDGTIVLQPQSAIMPPAVDASSAPTDPTIVHGNENNTSPTTTTTTNTNHNHPPPKTDKPRPHVCNTCTRSFARLEHLKRHERSHTKEKPFECGECTRAFARRDLLLRHQQKLHNVGAPAGARPRNARRESTSSNVGGPGRVRKNSVATDAGNSMRPRANTISHVDATKLNHVDPSSLNFLHGSAITGAGGVAAAAARHAAVGGPGRGHGHSHHASISHLPGPGGFEFRGMSTAAGHHGHQPLKVDTTAISHFDHMGGAGGPLRTAPPYNGFGPEHDFDGIYFGNGAPASATASTVNPSQLHFSDSPQSFAVGTPSSPNYYPPHLTPHPFREEDEQLDIHTGFDHHMSLNHPNDSINSLPPYMHHTPQHQNSMDRSSPSAISTTSQSGVSEVMLDGSGQANPADMIWTQGPVMPSMPAMPPVFPLELGQSNGNNPNHTNTENNPTAGPSLGEMGLPPGTISPETLHGQQPNPGDAYYSTPHPAPPPPSAHASTGMSPPSASMANPNHHNHPFSPRHHHNNPAAPLPVQFHPQSGPVTYHGPAPAISAPDSITDATRQALLESLAHRHTATGAGSPTVAQHPSLPSTQDLQRFVAAYINCFHPHLPFLHIPTLAFDAGFANSFRSNQAGGVIEGGGCLILSMAAIGAFYEFDPTASEQLFESAKSLIQVYLEERRKADVSAALSSHDARDTSSNTPLWLVQAMLLNIVYGIDCGNKTSGDNANTHCAALVSLARAAGLNTQPDADVTMMDWSDPDVDASWHRWVAAEERKRTLYAVFIISSLFVSAFNHSPCLTNSEISIDLPSDEDSWTAPDAATWGHMGGLDFAQRDVVPFPSALADLLSASHREHPPTDLVTAGYGESTLRPSTFGCLVLVNALHNYIWETRQQHHARDWSAGETEAMHSHIEPALRAWQAAWGANATHSVERPNPSGRSVLSADCVPLLDLAYVRLFVNLGKTKEAFWQRNYDGMADEFARGVEIVQHAGHASEASHASHAGQPGRPGHSVPGSDTSDQPSLTDTPTSSPDIGTVKTPTPSTSVAALPPGHGQNVGPGGQAQGQNGSRPTTREKHLRKAACYAADSLLLSANLNATFADYNSRQLPLSSAMCTFDCAQVVSEWVTTVQERVGRFLGVLGRDAVDMSAVPGIMVLDEQDSELLSKLEAYLGVIDGRISETSDNTHGNVRVQSAEHGLGTKLLTTTARLLDRAAVWPITELMARSLDVQAGHLRRRTEESVSLRS